MCQAIPHTRILSAIGEVGVPFRKLGEDGNLLDHQPACPTCGQKLDGFWFSRAPGQAYAVTIKLGGTLDCQPADARLAAYSICRGCWSHLISAVILQGQQITHLEIEKVEPYFQRGGTG
jgi:hypothetical protein